MHAACKSAYGPHNCTLETKVSLGDWAFLHLAASDDEVATEQLTAIADVTFMPHNDLGIS